MPILHSTQCLAAGLLASILAAAGAGAQAPTPVTREAAVSATAVIQAIDAKTRLVTLKNEDGTLESIMCGPDVQRFDALKVGDRVTFRYYESVVFSITQPGKAVPPRSTAEVVREGGSRPGGTLTQVQTATVTVLAIDPAVPSITIAKEDGSKASFKVEDRRNIDGLKVGDKVQITYTQALAISVKTP